MVKYRRLTIEELSALESEFVRFLAAQSILAEDWEKIKNIDKERESELIDLFSDVVIEKTLYNAEYLEQRTSQRILCYKVEEDKILLQGLELGASEDFDFTSEFQLSTLVNLLENPNVELGFISGTKDADDINKEVFALIEEDAMISIDSHLYDFIGTLKEHYSE